MITTTTTTTVWPGHAVLEAAEAAELDLLIPAVARMTPAIPLVRRRQADEANAVVFWLLVQNLLVLGDPRHVTWHGQSMTVRRVALTPRGETRLLARRRVLAGGAR